LFSNKQNRWDIQYTEDEKKIWAIAKDRYKGWRSTFSATDKAYNNYHARMKHKPEDLDIVEWHYLILYFGSNEFQVWQLFLSSLFIIHIVNMLGALLIKFSLLPQPFPEG
jgi:hypothetical protein